MRKKIVIALVILLVLAFASYQYMYKSHRDIADEDASFSETVAQVHSAFIKNDSLANVKYLDKTIAISGKITSIDAQNKLITVDEMLTARLTNGVPSTLKPKNTITLKGRVVGYDDLLQEIKMDQCTIKQ